MLQVSDDAAHAVRQAGTRQWPVAPVFSGGQVTELVGIENTAGVTVRQGLALRPLFELPGGEREMHQHGDVMRTIVAVALKADFADGVAVRQVFFQHLPFLQETETVQLGGDFCAGVEEGFAGGHGWWVLSGGTVWLSHLTVFWICPTGIVCRPLLADAICSFPNLSLHKGGGFCGYLVWYGFIFG